MLDKRKSLSMPQLSLLNEDGEELPVLLEDIEEDEVFQDAPIISPLTPKLTPTIRAQNLSPFWLSGANNLPLPQISGSTGDSPLDPLRSPGAGVGFSMLHAAAITGDCSGLEKLASGNFCDIDLRDKFGRTPLMYAILGNYPACVDILLQNGSNATLVDSSGRNSLHWAVHHDNFDCVRSILSKVKLDWKTPDQGGVTILHLAARHPTKKVLKLIIKHFKIKKSDVDVVDVNNRTPLHWAASNLRPEHAKLLIKLGADPGIVDAENKTPMHWAVSSTGPYGKQLVNLLINTKPLSVINWQDYEGRMPLHLAVIHTNKEIVSVLISSPSCIVNSLDNSLRSPLHLAAYTGRADICSLLLDNGAKHDQFDDGGATPIHLATQSGCENTLQIFVSRGLENTLDLDGRTPLMWATARGIISGISALKTSFLEAKDAQGYTALHIAVSCGMTSSATALCKLGCSPSSQTLTGLTPLMLAAQLGLIDTANLLLEFGANLTDKDKEGRTALHHASQAGQSYLLCLLLKAGASVNDVDRYGRSALHISSYGGYLEIISVLLEEGSDINLQDHEGFCSLHWAVRRGQIDVVKFLLKNGAFPNNVGVLEVGSDTVQITPLDSALMMEQTDILSVLLENGGVRIIRIYNIAATRIQAYWRGYRIRKSFFKRKELLVKHEKLKKNRRGRWSSRMEKKKGVEEAAVTELSEDEQEKKDTPENSEKGLEPEKSTDEIQKEDEIPKLVVSASRIRSVAGRFLGSMVEGQSRSSYLRREDPSLPEQPSKHKKSKSERKGKSSSKRKSENLDSVDLSVLLDPETRSESRFSYNLNQ